MGSKRDEVAFGEGAETSILAEWMRRRGMRAERFRVIKSRPFQDWDFLVLDKEGRPWNYIEVKLRRQPFSEHGDSICPIRKHELAKILSNCHRIEFLLVTSYPDAMTECRLAEPPARRAMLGRRDRPHSPRVPHGFWSGGQLNVWTRQ